MILTNNFSFNTLQLALAYNIEPFAITEHITHLDLLRCPLLHKSLQPPLQTERVVIQPESSGCIYYHDHNGNVVYEITIFNVHDTSASTPKHLYLCVGLSIEVISSQSH